MGRVLFFVLLALLAYAGVVLARKSRVRGGREPGREEAAGGRSAPVRMAKCPVCGAFFPEDEAVLGAGVAYCSERCRARARPEER